MHDIPANTHKVLIPANEPVIIISRTVAAPRELVFRCYTEPEHLVRFWGPHGSTMPVCELDLRPGGVWRQVLRFPGMAEFPVTYVFLEIVPPERIEMRDAPHGTRFGDELPPPKMISTTTLEAVDGQTLVTVKIRFDTISARDATAATDFVKVITESDARFAAYVAELPRV